MQWYLRPEGFYKKLFLRELEFIKSFNKNHVNQLKYFFIDEGKHFIVFFHFGKDIILCMYPEVYPNLPISVSLFNEKTEIEKVKDGYIYTRSGLSSINSGYHQTNGNICYYHGQWNFNWGIEFIVKRVYEWYTDGRFIKENDCIIPSDELLIIFPEFEDKPFDRDWGLVDYFYINPKTILVNKFYYSNNKVNWVLPDLNEQITSINIPAFLKQDNPKILKGIFLINDLDIFYNKLSRFNIFLKCARASIPKGFMGIEDLIRQEYIEYPIPIININKKSNLVSAFLYKKDFSIDIEKINLLNKIYAPIKEKDMLKNLEKKKIAIVGLGTIGSTLAVQLIKSGVINLYLVDKDILEVKNVCRHELTLKDVGKNKAKAVQEKLLEINPSIDCSYYEGNAQDVIDSLLNYDLIISTVDNQESRFLLNDNLIPKRKIIIHINAFYNSVAGFVFISGKPESSCYKCFSHYLETELVAREELPDFASLVPNDEIYECGGTSVPGGSINTSFIAMYGAKIAINKLLDNEEVNENGYKYNFYLFSNEEITQNGKTFFKNTPTVIKEVIPSFSDCFICNKFKESLSSEEENLYDNEISKSRRDSYDLH